MGYERVYKLFLDEWRFRGGLRVDFDEGCSLEFSLILLSVYTLSMFLSGSVGCSLFLLVLMLDGKTCLLGRREVEMALRYEGRLLTWELEVY